VIIDLKSVKNKLLFLYNPLEIKNKAGKAGIIE
jgi:hypothetical protein